MSSWFRALMFVLLLASCGGGGRGPTASPHLLDDACAILRENPAMARAFRNTERRWGVPVNVQMATIYQESKFIADARTPFRYALGVIPMGRQSSAYGYSQALDGTWEEYQVKTGNRRSRRDSIADASDFMGWYMTGTNSELGISLADAKNQYLAYHEGRTGYRRGNHYNKSWLLRVADEVANRAVIYDVQLSRCRGVRI